MDFCRAVNVGIEQAGTPYVFLLNNDTLVCRHAIDYLTAALKADPAAFSAEAKMIQYQDRTKIDSAGTFYNAFGWAFARGKDKSAAKYNRACRAFAACGGAALYGGRCLTGSGDFDEAHFAYLEDVDVGYRARIAGYHNLYVPSARIIHVGSASSGSRHNEFKVHLSARNNVYLIYKNMPPLQIFLNLPFLFAGFLVKFLFFPEKGNGEGIHKRTSGSAGADEKKRKKSGIRRKIFGII